MTLTMATERDIIEQDGFLPAAFELANKGVVPALIADTSVFDAALDDYARRGEKRVPYIVTDAITEVAHDPNIARIVESVLDTDSWVMWGSNIRRSVPNQAGDWHVDLESVLWPTLTVAVGLDNCSPDGATWFIPGTNRIGKGPRTWVADCGSTADVLAKSKSFDERCRPPRQVSGFGVGSFYLFDAKCWHRADPTGSAGKLLLFLHYQRGDAKRIPLMLDYTKRQWSTKACPYIISPNGGAVKRAVHWPPIRQWVLGKFR